jgi:O-succinylbenzoic acid--CoA ligase
MQPNMINLTHQSVHTRFKLNGFHLSKEDLIRVAYSFIKEGEAYEKPVGNFIYDWFDAHSYIELKTSGSTGVPKTIRMEKQAMVNSALATGDYFGLHAGQKALLCLPMDYIAGKMMFVRAMILGLELDFIAPTSHPLLNNSSTYDFAAMVPMQAQNSIKALKNIKKVIIGGTAINQQLEKELLSLPIQVYETYGMTETCSHVAAKRIGSGSFHALPNVTFELDDRGCLVIEALQLSVVKITTNDLVELINPTQFILNGRIDNVINSGGVKVVPESIEAKLAPFISSRFYISSLPDEVLGQRVVLVIESEPFEMPASHFEGLSKFEKPSEILFKSQFEETASGKVIRN